MAEVSQLGNSLNWEISYDLYKPIMVMSKSRVAKQQHGERVHWQNLKKNNVLRFEKGWNDVMAIEKFIKICSVSFCNPSCLGNNTTSARRIRDELLDNGFHVSRGQVSNLNLSMIFFNSFTLYITKKNLLLHEKGWDCNNRHFLAHLAMISTYNLPPSCTAEVSQEYHETHG